MSLRRATMLTVIGIVCSFLIRTVGTLFPGIFMNSRIVIASGGIHLLAGVALTLFFFFLHGNCPRPEQRALRGACILAGVGSLASVFLHLKHLTLVVDVHAVPLFLMYPQVDAVLPLVSAATLVFFFVLFLKEMGQEVRGRLGRATGSAIVGSSIFVVLHTIVLIHFLSSGEFQWLAHLSRKVAIGTLPILAIAVTALLHFFVSFYRVGHPSTVRQQH